MSSGVGWHPAIQWLSEIWEAMPSSVIVKSFEIAGITAGEDRVNSTLKKVLNDRAAFPSFVEPFHESDEYDGFNDVDLFDSGSEEVPDPSPFQHDLLDDFNDMDLVEDDIPPNQQHQQTAHQEEHHEQHAVVENNATDINNNSIVNIQAVAANNPNENGNSNAANAALQQMQLMLNQMTQLSQPSVENMTQGQIINHFKHLLQRSFGVSASSTTANCQTSSSSANTTSQEKQRE